ncbi:MAG: 16S rRNA (adenine(1518)-N(6)/adenine(1519)-N(6))-dimethyltransferase RsmA [Rhodanobacteraceae bacterium]
MSARLKKHFGQHFLHDRDVLDRIVLAIAPQRGQLLVEIGPGAGALTLPLLDAMSRLTAIELDRDLHQPLRERAARHGQLDLIEANVLDVDFSVLARELGGQLRLVGNLPYYLSSPILFHCLGHRGAISDMTFLLQKEVVDRVVAIPGNKTYGRLSVMLQLACHAESLFEVPPDAFTPPPKVNSALLRLTPHPQHEQPDIDPGALQDIVRMAFGKRRKTLANALKGVLSADQIRTVGIDPGVRAETLEPDAFVKLARVMTR